MLPCEVLEAIRNDLKELIKPNSVPFEKKYRLGPGAEIEISISELDGPESYRILVDSSSGPMEARIVGHRRVPALLVGLTSQKVSEYVVDREMTSCGSTVHGGADEILILYDCVRRFKLEPSVPFTSVLQTPKGECKIFSITADGNRYRLEMITSHIYGESMKTIGDIGDKALIPEQCHTLLGRMLGEWLRPESVKSVKFALSDLEASLL
ncbi:MAG: hypothetical protein AB7W16_05505 [Candidatus Obscuribacterales bacterium]